MSEKIDIIYKLLEDNKIAKMVKKENNYVTKLYAPTYLECDKFKRQSYKLKDENIKNSLKKTAFEFKGYLEKNKTIDKLVESIFNLIDVEHNDEIIDQEIELVKNILRYNTDFRLKLVANKWYLHIPSYYQIEVNLGEEEKEDKTLKKGRWSKEDDEILLKLYKEQGATYCGELLNRTARSCINRFCYLINITSSIKQGRWSKEEDKILITNYREKGASYCGELLNRTARSCINRYNYIYNNK